MKTLTVRLPEELAAEIESESRAAGVSKSDVVRRRLEGSAVRRPARREPTVFELAADLIGSVNDARLPRDLAAHKKTYLRKWGYGKGRPR
jgi:Arc/MetJ-type ribon-helix-helix transcriptional regulator